MDYASLKIGATLHMGTYRIMKVLGQGGFGITYLAHDLNLDKPVAIKEFFPESLCGRDSSTNHITVATQSASETLTDLKQRFLKEARNIAKLNHPNIIRIYSAFEENNTAYYVMEYIHGNSLERIVRENGPLSEWTAVYYIEQIGNALEYLHANHMTHLDVKPANIMVSQENVPILIDFGLSKNYDTAGAPTTTTGPLGVSPGFSPTEQYILSGNTGFSPKSDLYSLAATLYYLVTAIIPSEAPMNVVSAMQFPPTVSPNLRNAIMQGMAAHPEQRHETLREFLNQLRAVSTPAYQQPTEPQQTGVATPQQYRATVQDPYFPKPEKNSNRGIIIGAIAGALVVAGLLVFFFTFNKNNSSYSDKFAATTDQATDEAGFNSRKLRLRVSNNSPYLAPMGSNTYYPSNLIDGNLATCWAVNLDAYGYANSPVWGPNIEVEPVEKIDYIVFYNGYGKDNKAFYNNPRPSWVQIYRPMAPDTGYPEDSQILYEGPLADTKEGQKLKINPNFDFTEPVTHIIMKFSDKQTGKYYYGSKYNDLSISEIEVWGHN